MGAPHRVDRNTIWAYTESFPQESAEILAARRAAELLGAQPVSPQTASLLTVLAATGQIKNALEIGTGTGVSALALLQGMPRGSAMTTLDIDSSREQKAKSIIVDSSTGKNHRIRTITGDARQVLPRLSRGSYDLIFIDAGAEVAEFCVYQSLALLQPGGLLILNDALHSGKVADPAQRDTVTSAHRRLLTEIQDCRDDVFVSLVHAQLSLYLVYKR